MTTFEKRGRASVPPTPPRTFTVYVVIRHTGGGDQWVTIENDLAVAMECAERIADAAALYYGHGSSSVFKATLTIEGEALTP